jgi:hypothetical protein
MPPGQANRQSRHLESLGFFALSVFSARPTGYISPLNKSVILSEALRDLSQTDGFMAWSRRTSAKLVDRCSWGLSGRKQQLKISQEREKVLEIDGLIVP